MKITVKTTKIEITVEDYPLLVADSYVKHGVPEIPKAMEAVINDAIRLHNAVSKDELVRNTQEGGI